MEFQAPLPPAVEPLVRPHTINTGSTRPPLSYVSIYHPGYSNAYQPLLKFPALDIDGVDYDLAYYACCIMIGNAWTIEDDANRPYLSTSSKIGGLRLTRPNNGILPNGKYWLHVPQPFGDSTGPYPITPSFDHWIFPHNNLPLPWQNLDILPVPDYKAQYLGTKGRENTVNRDECCRVTQAFCGCEQAHLVPRKQEPWFDYNGMDTYGQATVPPIQDINNTILLRADVHSMLDAKELVLVPKLKDGGYVLVLHVLHAPRSLHEQRTLFHNREIYQIYGVSPEYLFARFAWTIFSSKVTRLFESSKAKRFVLLVPQDANSGDNPTMKTMVVSSVADIPRFPGDEPSTSRKRSRSQANDRDRDSDGDSNDVENRLYWHYSVDEGTMVRWSDEDYGPSSSDNGSDSESERGRSAARSKVPRLSKSVSSAINSGSDMDNEGGDANLEVYDVGLKQAIPFKYVG